MSSVTMGSGFDERGSVHRSGENPLDNDFGSADRYRAWLVDFDGTLYVARYVRLCMAAELLFFGTRHIPAIRVFRQEHERLRQALQTAVADPYRLQHERTAERLGVDVTDLTPTTERWMVEIPCKWLRLFRRRSLLAAIARFRENGGKTAIVSDYPARRKLEALNALGLFDTIVANGEPGGPGRLKPWPDGLLLAAQRLQVGSGECLVWGDRPDADGQAARHAGMAFRRVG